MTRPWQPRPSQAISWSLLDPSGRICSTCVAPTFRDASALVELTDAMVAHGWVLIRDPD